MATKEKRIAELNSECEGELDGWISFGSAAAQQQQQQQQPLAGYDLLLLQEELQQKEKNFNPLLLAATLQQQNFCSRNYKTLCPFAWTPVGVGGFCEAPRAYIEKEMASAKRPSTTPGLAKLLATATIQRLALRGGIS
ncbi:plasmodium falciparum CPW-WPC domain-containing protein, putative [Eimeria tenella]|uniref:Plasmodium falciparum CPW-WPC domain-containing protein, putative n=1 Tax=Eimeria tenella TaxID=5802 RepID=U6L354_EIMTE|nr:plasmodium falciparum CPW-WPC domain-containing protein, putative [Eimeria tenella]CDJ42200.1 plasmodium falciparum CPW-WPC domain-containing protein, putative [Eimeria tenella]|eukprot:XP_013232950.1 plasmodium falciparum CPW-WPC domain-containing protein, putative [Eimeria tenella]